MEVPYMVDRPSSKHLEDRITGQIHHEWRWISYFENGDVSNVFPLNMVIFHCFHIRSFSYGIWKWWIFPMSFIRFLRGVKVFFGFSGPMVMIFVRSPKTLGLLNTPSIHGLFWLINGGGDPNCLLGWSSKYQGWNSWKCNFACLIEGSSQDL